MKLLIVEDNEKLRPALCKGFANIEGLDVVDSCISGEDALDICLHQPIEAILMDVHLAGRMNGIEAAVAIRREFPRQPVVFYSIQDDDDYYRDFLKSGILTHFAYLSKSNYLLPVMLAPLLHDAVAGRSFIDPDIADRVDEVRKRDENDPLALLEPNEREVALLLAQGMTNEQIAARLGFRDKRTIARVNGQIYTAWDIRRTTNDEKIARTRAALIVQTGRLTQWDEAGLPHVLNAQDEWTPWSD